MQNLKPPMDPQHAGSFTSQAAHAATENLLSLIRSKFPREVDELLAHEDAKKAAAGQRDQLSGMVESARNTLGALERELGNMGTVDFGNTIFTSVKATGRPARSIAAEIAHYGMLKDAAPEILKLARENFAAAEKKLRDFERQNAALLAEADGDVEQRRLEYWRQVQVEQDAAFEQREKAAAAQA